MAANNAHGKKDSPTRAPESGEPTDAGRSRGKVIAEGAKASPKLSQSAGRKSDKGNVGRVGEDLESGRHDAT